MSIRSLVQQGHLQFGLFDECIEHTPRDTVLALTRQLRATQADLAASSDVTGAAQPWGGDWELEQRVGTAVLRHKKVVNLDVKDDYEALDEALIALLLTRAARLGITLNDDDDDDDIDDIDDDDDDGRPRS